MELVTVNLVGKPRREFLHGREYLVAHLTSIVPGVLNGSKGALYYPEDEVSKDPDAWDGMPLVVYHPTRNGQHVSARHPKVLERQGIGAIYDTAYNGRLQHEGWFDVELTKAADQRFGTDVFNRLDRGEPIELSTGLFTDNEPAENGAAHNGRAYEFTARRYKPDHIAVLPNGVGACSIEDGCGVNVNTKRLTKPGMFERLLNWLAVNDQPRHPKDGTYQGKTELAAKRGFKDLTGDVEDEDEEQGDAGADAADRPGTAALHRVAANLGGDMDQHDASKQAASASVVAEHGPARDHALSAVDSSKSSNSKDAAASHKKAAESHEGQATALRKKGDEDGAMSHDTAAALHRKAASLHQATANNKGDAMDRKGTIDFIVANCDCWNETKDRETLNSFSDAKLKKMHDHLEKSKQQEVVANAAVAGFKHGNGRFRFDPARNSFVVNEKAEGSNADVKDDPKTAKAVKDKEDEEDGNDKIAKGDEGTVKNKKEMSDNEWLAAAPPSIRSAVRNAMQIEGVERARLIKKLVANVAGEERRKALVAKFSDSRQYDLAALQELVSLLPTTNDLRREADESVANYLGASAPAVNAFSDEDKGDILPLPVMDWGEVKQNKA